MLSRVEDRLERYQARGESVRRLAGKMSALDSQTGSEDELGAIPTLRKDPERCQAAPSSPRPPKTSGERAIRRDGARPRSEVRRPPVPPEADRGRGSTAPGRGSTTGKTCIGARRASSNKRRREPRSRKKLRVRVRANCSRPPRDEPRDRRPLRTSAPWRSPRSALGVEQSSRRTWLV